ncbi:MAG: GDSL-type esterase/lipase family protein [Ruminococcus sp.]|nr:GDSL-type esterase/lipase family protein [Ruminococcus sp.]
MKHIFKRIAAAVLAGAFALSAAGCMTKTVEVERETDVPPKITFLGDSIPAGYGLEGYSDDDNYSCMSYSNILKAEYSEELDGKCTAEMVNVAVTGDTSAQLLEHLESGEFDEALKDSDAVVISIGGNDILEIFLNFLGNDLGLNPDGGDGWKDGSINLFTAAEALGGLSDKMDAALTDYNDNFTEIISQIHGKTSARLFVQTLYNPFEYYDKLQFLVDFADEKIGIINQTITDNAVTEDGLENYTVVDVAASFKGRCGDLTTIKNFDIHPNAEGHKVIAEVVDKAVRSKTYFYPDTEEVTDKTAVAAAAAGGVLCAAIIVTVTAVIIRRKKKS